MTQPHRFAADAPAMCCVPACVPSAGKGSARGSAMTEMTMSSPVSVNARPHLHVASACRGQTVLPERSVVNAS